MGESSRTLSERAKEHCESLKRMDSSLFMFKHWLLKHPERESAPDFNFEVVKLHQDTLSRLVREAVIIQEKAALNSKSEWGGYRIGGLPVDKSDNKAKKEVEVNE